MGKHENSTLKWENATNFYRQKLKNLLFKYSNIPKRRASGKCMKRKETKYMYTNVKPKITKKNIES